jgi:phosphonoacetaldehyde hydrolase
VYPLGAVIKVGDTASDIQEGLNAGVWSVGVAGTGNGIGLAQVEFQALEASVRAQRLLRANEDLKAAGAHYVVDTLADLPSVILDIESRLNEKTAA